MTGESRDDIYNHISFDCGFMFIYVRNGYYGAILLLAGKHDCISSV